MKDRNQRVLFKEMIFDLHYRLRLADDLFCRAAEDLVAAAALEEWSSRAAAVRSIGEYSGALRVIDQDLSLILEGKQAVFPACFQQLFDLFDSSGFAGQIAQVIQLSAANAAILVDNNVVNERRFHWEDTLNTNVVADLANGETLLAAAAVDLDYNATILLNTLLVTLLNAVSYCDCVTRKKLWQLLACSERLFCNFN